MALTTHSHLAPRLKKEHSYTSTPPLGLNGQFWGEIYHKIKEDKMGWVSGTYPEKKYSLHTEFWRGNLKRPLGRPCRS
jgi:hypothetical protein